MSREFLLIPKAKYESMMKSLDAINDPLPKTEMKQNGGKLETESTPEPRQEEAVSEKTQPIPVTHKLVKVARKLHVKRTLSDMESLFQSPKRTKKNPKKSKWVTYIIS